jgi:hypothetical protein
MKKLIMGLALAANIGVLAQPTIEIGLLLDSSGSMGGLINKTRNTLWEVLNILDEAKKDGEVPKVSLGLYSYGNGVNPDAKDEIVMISNLTSNLDELSNKFFELQASGSYELAGATISQAVKNFSWSNDGDFKALFLAGNETLMQGELTVEVAAKQAINGDIVLNTLYAQDSYTAVHTPINTKLPSRAHIGGRISKIPTRGPVDYTDNIKEEWSNLAVISGGSFAQISNNEVLPHIETPYDKQLLDLDKKLNETFVYFGPYGKLTYDRMINLDSQIGNSSGSAMVSRGRYKVGHGYNVSQWDLVDAYFNGKVKLSEVDMKTLKKELQGLNQIELLVHLNEMKTLRDEIKEETKLLYAKHKAYVDQKRKEMGKVTIEMVMIKSLKDQLVDKGFEFQ